MPFTQNNKLKIYGKYYHKLTQLRLVLRKINQKSLQPDSPVYTNIITEYQAFLTAKWKFFMDGKLYDSGMILFEQL